MWTAGKLTDVRVRSACPGTHGDGNGLYLVVRQGSVGLNRSWLYRYSVAGRSHWTGLGGYPDISLQRARQKAQECRQQLYEGTVYWTFPALCEGRRPRFIRAKQFRIAQAQWCHRWQGSWWRKASRVSHSKT